MPSTKEQMLLIPSMNTYRWNLYGAALLYIVEREVCAAAGRPLPEEPVKGLYFTGEQDLNHPAGTVVLPWQPKAVARPTAAQRLPKPQEAEKAAAIAEAMAGVNEDEVFDDWEGGNGGGGGSDKKRARNSADGAEEKHDEGPDPEFPWACPDGGGGWTKAGQPRSGRL